MTRQCYFKTHHPKFDHKVPHDLSHKFWKMADSTGLLDSDVYEVQDTWTGWKELLTANHAVKSSSKDIHYFWVILSTESPKIMGLKGIHFPKALKWWTGLSFCPWCGREGQNEGTVVNHLITSHYCLGLICGWCLEYFTTSSDMIHHHSQGSPSVCAHSNDGNDYDCEEELEGGNGKDNNDFTLA